MNKLIWNGNGTGTYLDPFVLTLGDLLLEEVLPEPFNILIEYNFNGQQPDQTYFRFDGDVTKYLLVYISNVNYIPTYEPLNAITMTMFAATMTDVIDGPYYVDDIGSTKYLVKQQIFTDNSKLVNRYRGIWTENVKYLKYDLVLYNFGLYYSLITHTSTSEFNETNWMREHTSLDPAIDVVIAAPAEGHILEYDETISAWINTTHLTDALNAIDLQFIDTVIRSKDIVPLLYDSILHIEDELEFPNAVEGDCILADGYFESGLTLFRKINDLSSQLLDNWSVLAIQPDIFNYVFHKKDVFSPKYVLAYDDFDNVRLVGFDDNVRHDFNILASQDSEEFGDAFASKKLILKGNSWEYQEDGGIITVEKKTDESFSFYTETVPTTPDAALKIEYQKDDEAATIVAELSKDGKLNINQLNFNTTSLPATPLGKAEVRWSQTEGTIEIGLDTATLQIGQEYYFYAKADVFIANRTVVQFAGVQDDHLLVKPAVPAEINDFPELILGVATQDINQDEFGYITAFGKVNNVSTEGFIVADSLWFDSTSLTNGNLTNVEPSFPYAKVLIAEVLKVETSPGANDGTILIRPIIKFKPILEIKITYAQLKTLKTNSELIPGMLYHITDYECTTAQLNTQSAGHAFDIIITADSINKLNENAYACLHENDTYFVNSKLESWKLKYCLDNDTARFAWADAVNGKGVIYQLIDEFNNNCPYDFKNIKFAYDESYAYTFSGSMNIDMSIEGTNCYNNVIGKYIFASLQQLNFTIFLGNSYNNTLGNNCSDNIIGNNAENNIFNDACTYNTLGSNCYNNKFGILCSSNSLGDNCANNQFDDNATANSFGLSCSYNKITGSANVFGDNCSKNVFMQSSYNNFVKSCSDIVLGVGCMYLQISDNSSVVKKNLNVESGLKGASSANKFDLYDTVILDKSYQITYKKDADGRYVMTWLDDYEELEGKYKDNNLDVVWKALPHDIDGGTF